MKGEVLLVISLLLLTLILLANIFHKVNVPLIMMSLLIGIIFGSDVTGLIYFDELSPKCWCKVPTLRFQSNTRFFFLYFTSILTLITI